LADEKRESDLIACRQCDALYGHPKLLTGQRAKCGRCGATLCERKVNSIERTFALSTAGLILLTPAVILPIMGIALAGQYHEASLLDSIRQLIDKGYFMIATLVFMFAIAVPAVRLIGAFYISYCFKFNKIKPSLLNFFRAYHRLDSWSMLNVFLLGIVVSMYKLLDDTKLSVDHGLLAFVLLLICSTMASMTLDQHYVWQELEKVCFDENS
jgi:paraquat-inducible protein A|tara:strand:- start:3025 stop:3660 length:636 start_codon:yes stop_codon:yes gene_type:complete